MGFEQVAGAGEGLPASSDAPLFRGKLERPEAAREGVLRPRLHARLDAGADAGIVLVCAPAGAGKTRLLAAWAERQRIPRDVAWLTLDRADRDPSRFLRYLTAAVAGTRAGRDALAGLAVPPSSNPPDEAYLGVVADAMAHLSDDVVLALDGFEHVVGSETEGLLERILRYPPDRVRLFIASRVEPRLGQPRLRLTGHLVELDGADLALTLDETREVIRSHHIALDDGRVTLLHERTQGWVAAVRFLAATLKNTPEAAAYLVDLPHRDEGLSAYLLAEVYDRQPPEQRRLLLRTSVVDALCPGLAKELAGPVGDGMARLQRQQLLIRAPDLGSSWYRGHPLVLGLLRARLHDEDPELEKELHLRAAAWLREEGLTADSVRQALAERDTDAAAADLGGSWLGLVTAGDSALLGDLLALFPEHAVLGHPDVAVAAAFTAVRRDDVETSLGLVARALAGATSLPPSRRQSVLMIATIVRLYAAALTGRLAGNGVRATALELLHQAPLAADATTREARTRVALLLENLGAFETSRQRYDIALPHLEAALTEARLLDLPYLELSCSAQLIEHDLAQGRLTAAADRGSEILTTARERGWASAHGLTTVHVSLAAVALLRDDLSGVFEHLAEAQHMLRPVDHMNQIRISLLRAIALCGTGRPREAALALEELRPGATAQDAPGWVPATVNAVGAWLDACRGDPEAGLRRLDAMSGTAAAFIPHEVLRADLLFAIGRARHCEELLAPWLKGDGRFPADVLARVLGALVAEELGRHEESLAGLDAALAVAGSEGLLMPLLLPGPPVRALLEDLVARGTANEAFALEALEHLVRHEHGTLADAPYFIEPLSGRELEVLRLLQGTGTNPEIAERLYISAHTLRSHIKNINRKLDAANRRDAVRRARELGIL